MRASVCTVGFGWVRTAARKRRRSSAVRYFRPRWSTSSPAGGWGMGAGLRLEGARGFYVTARDMSEGPDLLAVSGLLSPAIAAAAGLGVGWKVYTMNRIFWVVRSMTKKIIELSRGVVMAPPMGKVTAESESISSTCRRRRLPIDGTSIQDPVAEVVRSRRRARIGAIHPGAGSVGAEAPARPGSANSAIQLSAAAGHHGGRSAGRPAGTRIDARICNARTRIRRSVPRPHCRHTVMSIPVRRSIIASGVSGSPGVGRTTP